MKIENADITWLESGLPYSTQFEDIYYSRDDELAESQHVFLEANKLKQRWKQGNNTQVFHIGELGFGSGLNFLQTMKLWEELEERPRRLHYIAFEKHPLRHKEMLRIHQRWASLASQSATLLEQYTDHAEGCHRLQLRNGVILDLYYGDAQEQLRQRMADACPAIQCWFLDGFSPARDTQLWEEELMKLLASCSDETTTLSTYSVAGKVRSAIKSAGFEVSKIEGFGKKRNSLFASLVASRSELATTQPAYSRKDPWFILPRPVFKGCSAIVVGAGLAGCSTAYSLAERGWEVTVIDAGSAPASGASGNSQLALRCRLFNAASPEAKFFLHAYLFALRQFTQLRQHSGIAWNSCGVLQLANAMNKRNPLQQEKLQQLYSTEVVQRLGKAEASHEAGIDLADDVWFFPRGGAMQPSSLCETYLDHKNIRCIFNNCVTDLEEADGRWRVDITQKPSLSADAVIVANSHSAALLDLCKDLPLQTLRGQTSEISANEQSGQLTSVVSGGRTIFPAHNERHLLSASYANCRKLSSLVSDSEENIELAAANFATSGILNTEALFERVSLRCNSPDRMPLVGMAPHIKKMKATYAELSKNAKAKFNVAGDYHEGLYLNIAHGSNGLASCPIAAEFLASLITEENLPLSREIAASLNPTRFLIKDLKKQR